MPIPKLNLTDKNEKIVDYQELAGDLFIHTDVNYDKPPVCIEIIQKGKQYRYGTFGNFSVVGGKGKARKGYYVSAIIGSSLCGQKILNIQSYFSGKKIVLFDTEQGDYDVWISAKRAIRLNQLNYHPENFDVFALRQLSTHDRVGFIESYFERNKDLGLVVIDGVRDLLIDINNTDQSTELATKIMQWTKVYNFHLVAVLHENPGSDKLRGHIGTELTNKAEMVVAIEVPKDNEMISMVIPRAVRGALPFNEFSFCIGENGLPEMSNYTQEF